jgi:hypothetical protein
MYIRRISGTGRISGTVYLSTKFKYPRNSKPENLRQALDKLAEIL